MGLGKVKSYTRCFYRAFYYEARAGSKSFTIHWLTWIFPLLLYALLTGLFSQSTLLELPVAVVDNDNSQLSRKLIREFDASSHANVIHYKNGLPEALQALEQANVYSILYIPVDFEKSLFARKQATPVLYYNALFYGSGYFSTQDYPTLITELNNTYRSSIAKAYGIGEPNLSKVSIVYNNLFNATSSYAYYQQFAATIHILQLFIVTCMIYVLSHRKELLYARPFLLALIGKLAPYTLVYITTLMAALASLIFFSSARIIGNPLDMLIVSIFYVIAAQSVGVLLFTFTKSALTAYSLIGLIVASAINFSGLTVPALAMPLPAQIIAELQPLTHALYTMFDIFLRDVHLSTIIKSCLILSVYPIITIILTRHRLLRRLHIGAG